MERGRVAEAELMPRLVVGYTELGGGNLKKDKGFLKPNFELGPNPAWIFISHPGLACRPPILF